jgi:hypothetical protein
MICMSLFFLPRFVAIAAGQGQGECVNPEKGVTIDGKSDVLLLVGPKGEVWIQHS